MANLVTFMKKLWKDATSGGTPITAAELNRMEGGISDCATQINKLGDSVSRLCVSDDLRKLEGNDFDTIGNCFQAIHQATSWTAGQHGPVGTNAYGFLLSTRGGDSNMQLFIDNTGKIAFRVRFSGNATWPSWNILDAHS